MAFVHAALRRVAPPAARLGLGLGAPAAARLFRAAPPALKTSSKDRGSQGLFDALPDAGSEKYRHSFGWKHRPSRARQGGIKARRGPMNPGRPDFEDAPSWEDPEAATREALMMFIDPYELNPELGEPGRRWRASDLRGKSNEDLQKLWVVLLRVSYWILPP